MRVFKLNRKLVKLLLFIALAFLGFLLYNFAGELVEKSGNEIDNKQSYVTRDKDHNRIVHSPDFNRTQHSEAVNDTVYRGMGMTRYNDHFFVSDFGDYKVKKFDLNDGSLFIEMNTPVPTSVPKVEEDIQNGERRVAAPTTQYVNSHMLYIQKNNTLAVSTYYRGDEIREGEYDEKTAAFWIDFYDLDDWTYRDSIKLPHAVSTFFISENTFYTYNTTSAAGRSYNMKEELREIIYR